MKTVNVKQDEEKVIAVEVMAESIKSISDGIKKLRSTRLSDKALFLLIQHASPSVGGYPKSKVSMREIEAVFEGIESLERIYLKKT